jgi:hypothetical protein
MIEGYPMETVTAQGMIVRFDPQGGIIDDVAIEQPDGTTLHPMHRAPWVRDGEVLPDSVAPVEQRLAGDFFCAPFGGRGSGAPIHGWSANGTWESFGQEISSGAVTAHWRLRETVDGARLTKHITLCEGHPIVYQSHVFEGGSGTIPVAHHAMVHVPGRARLSFSPKAVVGTPATALETDPQRGRSVLAYPQKSDGLTSLRRADGTMVDASLYPFDQRHEDLVVMGERPGATIGWSAALASNDGFLFFAIKDARLLPQTILWMSNGGRDYTPWNSRHIAVLGIEEAAADLGIAAEGRRVGLRLAPAVMTDIRYAFGAIPAPAGWTRIVEIKPAPETLTLVDESRASLTLPFRGSHFPSASGFAAA